MNATHGARGSDVPEHDDPVAILRRWEDAGGVWRVAARSGDRVTVALCRCDGGEEADRLTSADPDLLAFVDGTH